MSELGNISNYLVNISVSTEPVDINMADEFDTFDINTMEGASSCVKHKQLEDPYGGCSECSKPETKYVITGVDRSGKRFSPINTDTPWHYNIWRGTIWRKLTNGKRKRVKEIWN